MRSSSPSSRRPSRPRLLSPVAIRVGLAALILAGATAACGTGASASPTGLASPTISDAWVRLPDPMADLTAAYLTVTGGRDADAIVAVTSPIATDASLHRTSTDASGMTGMQAVDRIDVPAGATVQLAPGGYHVMLEGLTGTLAVGQTVQLTLTFEHAGAITVQAVVRQG